jgi:hypothetical protein
MKYIKQFKIFNESLKDKLKGKSNDELLDSFNNLINSIVKYLLRKENHRFKDYNDTCDYVIEKYKEDIIDYIKGGVSAKGIKENIIYKITKKLFINFNR